MGRLGFYFDMDRCIGCGACQVACKDRNSLEAGVFFRRVTLWEEEGGRLRYYSGACNHCGSPACVAACPTGAMHPKRDGTVGHDRGRCIGCGCCVWSCPYGAPTSGGTAPPRKCDACGDLREGGENPACVDACPLHCLRFGEMEELEGAFGPGLRPQIPFLPERSLTEPSLLIRTGGGK